MIEGIGLDLVELDRIEKLYNRQKSFLNRVLTPDEQTHFHKLSKHRQIEFLAGRFAAKEAFAKAIGTGIGAALSFQEIEILPNPKNKPIVKTNKYSGKIHLSISHAKTIAMAQIILEKYEK